MHDPWDLTNIPNTQNELSDQSDEREKKEKKLNFNLEIMFSVPPGLFVLLHPIALHSEDGHGPQR